MTKIELAESAIKHLRDFVELEKVEKKMTTQVTKCGVADVKNDALKTAFENVKEMYKVGD